ncbi:hypothetical protein BV20DRAFT_14017 [Pilatotrama ljubarskyi]|nr:hypothetical protein BV20DRAFT_14017 [Pilatotrama ljubarskyi]
MEPPNPTAPVGYPCEQIPLVGEHGSRTERQYVDVAPLKYGDVPTGADTVYRAFVNDSIMEDYRSVDTAPLHETRWRIRHNLTLVDAVHQGRVLTVNQGKAVLL